MAKVMIVNAIAANVIVANVIIANVMIAYGIPRACATTTARLPGARAALSQTSIRIGIADGTYPLPHPPSFWHPACRKLPNISVFGSYDQTARIDY